MEKQRRWPLSLFSLVLGWLLLCVVADGLLAEEGSSLSAMDEDLALGDAPKLPTDATYWSLSEDGDLVAANENKDRQPSSAASTLLLNLSAATSLSHVGKQAVSGLRVVGADRALWLTGMPAEGHATLFPRTATTGSLSMTFGDDAFLRERNVSPTVDLALEGVSGIHIPSVTHLTIDLSGGPFLTAPLHLKAEGPDSDWILLASESGGIPPIRFRGDSLVSFAIMGGDEKEVVHVGSMPESYTAHFRFEGRGGEDLLVMNEDYNNGGGLHVTAHSFTAHKALDSCPVTVSTPTMPFMFMSETTCTGSSSISVVASHITCGFPITLAQGSIILSGQDGSGTVGVDIQPNCVITMGEVGDLSIDGTGQSFGVRIRSDVTVQGVASITGTGSPSTSTSDGIIAPSGTLTFNGGLTAIGMGGRSGIALGSSTNVEVNGSCMVEGQSLSRGSPSVGVRLDGGSFTANGVDTADVFELTGTSVDGDGATQKTGFSGSGTLTISGYTQEALIEGISDSVAPVSAIGARLDDMLLSHDGTDLVIRGTVTSTGATMSGYGVFFMGATISSNSDSQLLIDGISNATGTEGAVFIAGGAISSSLSSVSIRGLVSSDSGAGDIVTLASNSNVLAADVIVTAQFTGMAGNGKGIFINQASITTQDGDITIETGPLSVRPNVGIQIDSSPISAVGQVTINGSGVATGVFLQVADLEATDDVTLTAAADGETSPNGLLISSGNIACDALLASGIVDSSNAGGNSAGVQLTGQLMVDVNKASSLAAIGAFDGAVPSFGLLISEQGSLILSTNQDFTVTADAREGRGGAGFSSDGVIMVASASNGAFVVDSSASGAAGEMVSVACNLGGVIDCNGADCVFDCEGIANVDNSHAVALKADVTVGMLDMVTITGKLLSGGFDASGILVLEATFNVAATGLLTLDGSASSTGFGVVMNMPVTFTGSGELEVVGQGGTVSGDGVGVGANLLTGGLRVTLIGDAQASAGDSVGVRIAADLRSDTSPGSTLTIVGTGSPSVTAAPLHGVYLVAGAISYQSDVTITGNAAAPSSIGVFALSGPIASTEGDISISGASTAPTGLSLGVATDISITSFAGSLTIDGASESVDVGSHAIQISGTSDTPILSGSVPTSNSYKGYTLEQASPNGISSGLYISNGAQLLSDFVVVFGQLTGHVGVNVFSGVVTAPNGIELIGATSTNTRDDAAGISIAGTVSSLPDGQVTIQGDATSCSDLASNCIGVKITGSVFGRLDVDGSTSGPNGVGVSLLGATIDHSDEMTRGSIVGSHDGILNGGPTFGVQVGGSTLSDVIIDGSSIGGTGAVAAAGLSATGTLSLTGEVTLIGTGGTGATCPGLIATGVTFSVINGDGSNLTLTGNAPVSGVGLELSGSILLCPSAVSMCSFTADGFSEADSGVVLDSTTLEKSEVNIIGTSQTSSGVLVLGMVSNSDNHNISITGMSTDGIGIEVEVGGMVTDGGGGMNVTLSGMSSSSNGIVYIDSASIGPKTGGSYSLKGEPTLLLLSEPFEVEAGPYEIILSATDSITARNRLQLSCDGVLLEALTVNIESGMSVIAAAGNNPLRSQVDSYRIAANLDVRRPTNLLGNTDVDVYISSAEVGFEEIDGAFDINFLGEGTINLNGDIGGVSPPSSLRLVAGPELNLRETLEGITAGTQEYDASFLFDTAVGGTVTLTGDSTIFTGMESTAEMDLTIVTDALSFLSAPYSHRGSTTVLPRGIGFPEYLVQSTIFSSDLTLLAGRTILEGAVSDMTIGDGADDAQLRVEADSGPYSADSVIMEDNTTLIMLVGGSSANPGTDYSQLDLSGSLTLIGDVTLNVVAYQTDPFSTDAYPLIVGLMDPDARFANFDDAAAVVVGSVVMETGYSTGGFSLTQNRSPTADDDLYSVTGTPTVFILAPGVLGNDSDPEGAPLTAVLVSPPTSGSLTLFNDGSFSYSPGEPVMVVTFTYRASDGVSTSNIATVTLDPNGLNPTATSAPTPSQAPTPILSTTRTPALPSSASASATRSPASSSPTVTPLASALATPLASFSGTVTRAPSPSAGTGVSPSAGTGVSASPSPVPPTVTASSSLFSPGPTATASPSGFKSSPSAAASMTTIASASSLIQPPVGPSSQPSSSASKTRSAFRIPTATATRTRAIIPSDSICPSCVVPVVAPVSDDSDGPVTIVLENGTPAGTVTVPSSDVPQDVIVLPASRQARDAADRLEVASAIVDILLINRNGDSQQPSGDVEICLEVEEDQDADDACLGFYDEEIDEFVCEDPCVKRRGNALCGTSDHLTNFAILLGGGNGGSSGRCGDDGDSDNYIFGSAWKDAILVGSVVLCAIFIMLAFLVIAFSPLGSKLHGKEYDRIHNLRSRSSSLRTGDTTV